MSSSDVQADSLSHCSSNASSSHGGRRANSGRKRQTCDRYPNGRAKSLRMFDISIKRDNDGKVLLPSDVGYALAEIANKYVFQLET